jgi:hypothetical protein
VAAFVRVAGNAEPHLRGSGYDEVRMYRFVGSYRVLSAAELGKFNVFRRGANRLNFRLLSSCLIIASISHVATSYFGHRKI